MLPFHRSNLLFQLLNLKLKQVVLVLLLLELFSYLIVGEFELGELVGGGLKSAC